MTASDCVIVKALGRAPAVGVSYNLIILNEVGYVPFVQVVPEVIFEPSSHFADGDNSFSQFS